MKNDVDQECQSEEVDVCTAAKTAPGKGPHF